MKIYRIDLSTINSRSSFRSLNALFAMFALGLVLVHPARAQSQDTASSKVTTDDGWVQLFDGKSLDNWEGPAKLWRVEDECIVGQSTAEAPIPHNLFLTWTGGEIANFELRLEYWIDSGNSGVQFRSHSIGEHRIGGYQADLEAGKNYTGIIYEEGGRGILCLRGKKTVINAQGEKSETDLAFDANAFAEKVKPSQWNEYVIRADGNHITQSINGIVVAELIDQQSEKAAKQGLLALQLHAGPPMTVKFKNIRLKTLEK